MVFPKIELHVHLEGTVRPRTLLPLARRNGVSLPADTPMFSTDLTADYAAAIGLGVAPEACFAAGLRGALCDEVSRAEVADIGARYDWARSVVASQL